MKKLIPLIFVIIPIFFVTCKKPQILLDHFYIMGDSTLIKGETSKYIITYNPEKATNAKFLWSSSDENVLTIASDGTATAKNYGSATIQVQSMDGTDLIKTFNVYVVAKTQISILSVDSISY